jgi:hypothetical protein
MTAKPWRPLYRRIVQSAIRSNGVRGHIVRIVTHNPQNDRYYVYRARGGVIGKLLAKGIGTQQTSLLHGCAKGWCLNMPGVWKKTKGVTK